MEYVKGKITNLLVDFFEEDFRRITHALEVLKYSEEIIQKEENYDYDTVVASALLHDVGIKPSEKELGYNSGKTQEKYGPPITQELLKKIDFPDDKIRKVSEIIGNHHSPSKHDYVELKILKEADRIVNKKDKEKEAGS